MFANVRNDDHHCPDKADNARQGIRKRHETGHQEYRNIVFQFPFSMHQLFSVWCDKLYLSDLHKKKSMGVRSGERAKWHPFVQSMCLEKLHRSELVHRDVSRKVLHLAESKSCRRHQTSQ